MFKRIGLLMLALTAISGLAAAQSGGQLCVRAFEDSDGNGRYDAGEQFIRRDVGVNLLDAGGLIIASALMESSPTSAQGVICFQFLPTGQYTVVITSAAYTATTPETITTSITESGLPTVVDFGAQVTTIPEAATASPTTTAPPLDVMRLLVSGAGALIALAFMTLLGFVIYVFAFARRPLPADLRRTTGSIPALRQTGELRRTRDLPASRPLTADLDKDEPPF
ncbi:MAG: hypothetical protein HXY41_15735 [Chloroflexi bacterium]|nr:hypothetical protein [Chloroflexota bacterium]